MLALLVRDVEIHLPKSCSQSSSKPPTLHLGQIPRTRELALIYQPWSFCRHFKYLVKSGSVIARASSLLPPRASIYSQPPTEFTPPHTWKQLPLSKSSSNILEMGKMLLQPRGPCGECAQSWRTMWAGK